jgi:bacteriocin biosynthesis cyclodehydratase domain-containing protein
VAYHHTVSLGPLVVAGETACFACLAGRIGAAWGDPAPPERPAVLGGAGLAAALAVRELEAVAGGDVRLANATAAYDLASHRVLVETLYRLPWCPICGDRSAPEGPIALPWADAA